MESPLDSLIEAIITENLAGVKRLLKKDPALAKALIKAPQLERRLPHWIYAKDTPLHVAAAGYRIEIAKLLLDAGADPKAAFNHRRSQPLHYAADGYIVSDLWNEKKQVAMIRLLSKAGADINVQDKNGATPLHRAVRTRCAAAVKCLLEAGANPTVRNKPGSTSFHLAVQNTGRGGSGAEMAKAAQSEIIQAFLQRGLSPKVKDAKGKSVLDWAKSDWIRELLIHGKS
jgi:Ankyrin repeats (3 copies)/Ankyrin repeat